MWQYNGSQRPPFADAPGPGQESIWDYPRPPAIERTHRQIEVRSGETLIAQAERGWKVMETASPPTYYVSADDVPVARDLVAAAGSSFCEWKGFASYWAWRHGQDQQVVAWSYDTPSQRFAQLEGCFSFYPALLECYLDGERVQPQPGGFYGGWITAEIVGPWKGEAGTKHW